MPVDAGHPAVPRWADFSHDPTPRLTFGIHTRFDTIESEWRRFQHVADATPFQTCEWLAAWQRHIGNRDGVVPAIIVGRYADGGTAFIAPLAVEPQRLARRLCWLGQDLCDYNAPLLARDFSQRVTTACFLALWREIETRLRAERQMQYDWIEFEKMPQTVGGQTNPFVALDVIANANSAHIAQLEGDWETFYRAKRSSATRRHDRAKRKRMAEHGEISFRTVTEPSALRDTLGILWEQKKRIFARKGISDVFAKPGYREFFADFASNPDSRYLAHVSRVDIGQTCAAVNFAMLFGDCYYHVLASYSDGRLTRHGPGMLHLRELLAHAIGIGMRRFDFTIGDEHYKLEWTDIRLPLYDYSSAATLRGWPASVASIARRHAKRFIKQTPALWNLVTRARGALGPFLYPQTRQKNAAEN